MQLARSLGTRLVLLAMASALAVACASGEPGDSAPPAPGPEGAAPAVVEPVSIAEKDPRPVSGELSRSALTYVRNFDAELGIGDRDDFAIRQVRRGRGDFFHVRMDQLHDGLPVWGADVVVHSDGGRLLGLSGTLAKHLGELDATPAIGADDALAIAKTAYAGARKGGSPELEYARESAELVVFPGDGASARVSWHIVFFTELQAGIPPGLWNYFVDARSGDIVHRFNAIHTLEQASGRGGNPKVARRWVDQLDVEPQGSVFAMNTGRLVTTDMDGRTFGSGTIVTGALADIGDEAINDAHGFAEQTLDMLQQWYGHDSIDDNGFIIRSRVHYGFAYENAFWDGTRMTYGDGAATFFPLSGDADVVGHEIDHGFTTFHSNLTYTEQSGGNNESFSDIAGTIVEFFGEGDTADFDLGRDIFRGDDALRFMCDPTADGISIDHADDFRPGMDVHLSSGVMNKAFCRSARRLASGDPDGPATQAGVRRAGEAWYEANASFWTRSSGFRQACDGVLAAARSLGFSQGEIAAIDQSWQDVGVFCDGSVPPIPCDEILTGESGTLTSPRFPNDYPNNFSRTYCIEPASGKSATLTFDAFDTEAGFDFLRIREADGATLSNTSGTTTPPPAASTKLAITFTSDELITASGWSASWTTGDGGGGS